MELRTDNRPPPNRCDKATVARVRLDDGVSGDLPNGEQLGGVRTRSGPEQPDEPRIRRLDDCGEAHVRNLHIRGNPEHCRSTCQETERRMLTRIDASMARLKKSRPRIFPRKQRKRVLLGTAKSSWAIPDCFSSSREQTTMRSRS